jgi:hypothetical protein
MEEKVEFMVAHMLKVLFFPTFAVWNAAIIVPEIFDGHFGTQRVFPLLAII